MGDPDAGIRVAALYEAHGRTIVGLCRFLLRDPVEAEDAAQQSFLSAYCSLLGGAVPREPAAWLAAIARNECWARIKRRMREPLTLTLHELPAEQADTMELAARNADLAALRAGLEELSAPQREAFLLREFAGLSYRELSAALGVTEPAVDSLLFRARTRLRRTLRAANAIVVPVALRDQLARLIPGFDQPAVGTLARLASLPVAAKLAAAGAGVALVVAGSAGVGRHPSDPAVADTATAPHRAIVVRTVLQRSARGARTPTVRVRVAVAQSVRLLPNPAASAPAVFATSTRVGSGKARTADVADRAQDQPASGDPGTDDSATDDPGIIPAFGGGGGFTPAAGPSDNGPAVVAGGDPAGSPEVELDSDSADSPTIEPESSGSNDGTSAEDGSGSSETPKSGDVPESDGGESPDSGTTPPS